MICQETFELSLLPRDSVSVPECDRELLEQWWSSIRVYYHRDQVEYDMLHDQVATLFDGLTSTMKCEYIEEDEKMSELLPLGIAVSTLEPLSLPFIKEEIKSLRTAKEYQSQKKADPAFPLVCGERGHTHGIRVFMRNETESHATQHILESNNEAVGHYIIKPETPSIVPASGDCGELELKEELCFDESSIIKLIVERKWVSPNSITSKLCFARKLSSSAFFSATPLAFQSATLFDCLTSTMKCEYIEEDEKMSKLLPLGIAVSTLEPLSLPFIKEEIKRQIQHFCWGGGSVDTLMGSGFS
uniref:Uncharacterized protein n=1 Tax=Timema poppense TaxID=170557 RepID=A0A7R9DHU9_TIMPO|nr:unnamed protein product [Timema poppensis]